MSKLLEKIEADKEILSTMPKNNKKNIAKYIQKVQELKKEYETEKENLIKKNEEIFKLAEQIKKDNNVKEFMQDLSNSLENPNQSQELQENRKEGHLYLVTEDRNGEVYLWDFTDKPKHEFKEVITSDELLKVAKEGAMLQYKNGKYELYSENGYDMLEEE